MHHVSEWHTVMPLMSGEYSSSCTSFNILWGSVVVVVSSGSKYYYVVSSSKVAVIVVMVVVVVNSR